MFSTPHVRVTRVRLGLATLFGLSSFALLGGEAHASLQIRPQVIAVHPHDPDAFTQGLLFYEGELYESTGLWGESTLRRVELSTGEVLQQYDLPMEYFGEGLARIDQQLIQLTWQEHVAFVYDLESFAITGQFAYEQSGWGLTFDGTHLIMTDGWSGLLYRDPNTFEIVEQVDVLDGVSLITQANELEYVDGIIYANASPSHYILAIEPETGEVLLTYDCTELLPENPDLNGIAYDPDTQHFFLTGKNYPSLFEVTLPSPVSEDAPPSVMISSPSDQAQLETTQSIDIEIVADDGEGLGVARIELLLDGEVLLTRERQLLEDEVPWVIPNADFDAGEIALSARAYDAWGNMAESVPVTVVFSEPSADESADESESDSGSGTEDESGGAAMDVGLDDEGGCACVAATGSGARWAALTVMFGLLGLGLGRRRSHARPQ